MGRKPANAAPEGKAAALYMRLSREDENGAESASIATQRKILNAYARDNGFAVYDEYVDDGWSGTHFDRPAFHRLIGDIEAGKVHIVLTKDLSRLGRNSARTGDLIDEYFPARRVRYISVNEGIDTSANTASAMLAPITNAVNELYARDISGKIRSTFRTKMKNGEFIGSFAPFGYQKDPNNKNHLIVDEESAHVVRRIFDLARQGHAPSQIAKLLAEQSIPTPAAYRCLKLPHLNISDYSSRCTWEAGSVAKILKNICYLGHTAQGKTTKPSFKSRASVANDPRDWIVAYSTHPPLVDEETWNIVQRLTQGRTCEKNVGFTNLFSGLAKCADCGRSMSSVGTRKKGSPANLACSGYKLYGREECTNHHIDYNMLYAAVLQALRAQVNLSEADKQELFERMKEEDESVGEGRALEETQKRLDAISGKIGQLFDDKYSGRIPPEQFEKLYAKYEAQRNTLSEKTERLAAVQAIQTPEDIAMRHNKFRELIENYAQIRELSRELLFTLIDHIEVCQGVVDHSPEGKVKRQIIRIYFRFACEPGTVGLNG